MASQQAKLLVGLMMMMIACRSGRMVDRQEQGETGSAQVAPDAAPISTADVSVETSTSTSTGTAAAPQVEKPKEEADDKDDVAMEPVSIGGAFLTCSYPPNQMQGQAEYTMECGIAPLTEIKTAILQAAFVKLDSKNTATPLTILTQDLLALRWTIKEPAATIGIANRVQVKLGLLGGTLATLTTTVTSPLMLARSANYWLGGEPNNFLDTATGEDEDCVEFSNLANKKHHQEFTGLTTGPLGRLNDIKCSTPSRFLCRNISSPSPVKWKLSTLNAPWNQSAKACEEGYAFGFPLSDAEIKEVSAVLDASSELLNVWVNLNDRAKENQFVLPMQ